MDPTAILTEFGGAAGVALAGACVIIAALWKRLTVERQEHIEAERLRTQQMMDIALSNVKVLTEVRTMLESMLDKG